MDGRQAPAAAQYLALAVAYATLNGLEFTARYVQGADYARWVCQFREATIVGRFSPDFSTFEALETLVWGVPGNETVVQRR
jgi:hypothetical protein